MGFLCMLVGLFCGVFGGEWLLLFFVFFVVVVFGII